MKKRNKINQLNRALEMPSEIYSHNPKITMIGFEKIIIENYKNILNYLYWTFKVDFEKKYMGGTRGAAIPYIVKGDITGYKFLYNKEIIQKYINIVEPIINEINILNQSNENLIKQRDLLLPRLMSGKLEIK